LHKQFNLTLFFSDTRSVLNPAKELLLRNKIFANHPIGLLKIDLFISLYSKFTHF